jgi:uncharacterized protein (DUF342 family)
MAEPKDVSGYTTIATERDGVYLTVFPPTGKGTPVSIDSVNAELVKYNIVPESPDAVSQAVSQANGKPVKISSVQEMVFVEIDPDEMNAKITVLPPASEAEHFTTIDDVRTALARRNVTFGINENKMAELSVRLAKIANSKDMTESVEEVVAHGVPVVNGQDAVITYLYKKESAETVAAAPEQTEDGRIDYRAGHKIDNVTKGMLLARKIPAVKGVPGKTVTGKEIAPVEGKDIELIPNKGVILSPDNPNEFIADGDGQVIIKDKKISVLALYEIAGDVNFSTGNVDFIGTVVVKGDIKDGFKVHAGEDIIVSGVVEGAELKAGGKITVVGGVSGNDKARIVCKGDASVKYVRNAIVEVGGNLSVGQAIMHSKVTCEGKVAVAGQKGVIVGGQIIAGQEVSAGLIGSNFATNTEIIVGEVISIREELQKIEAEMKSVAENMDKTKKGMLFLKELHTKLGGNLPADKKELLTKLTRAQFKLVADSKILAERKIEFQAKEKDSLAEKKHCRVVCTGVIYSGVKIIINKVMRQISEELKFCTLTEVGGEIKVGPLKG